MELIQRNQETRQYSKEILKIGIPAFLESLFTTCSSIIDSKMVSALGITAISAISVTNQPRLFILCAFFAENAVITAVTARAIGKNDRDESNSILLLSLKFSTLAVAVLSILAFIFAEPIMRLCNGQPDTLTDSIIYFRIMMAGLVFNVETLAINAVLRGCGETRLTFKSNVIACLVNITLNYLLIEGRFGFPALGIRGAAIATVCGNSVSALICFLFILKKEKYINLNYCISHRLRISKDCLKYFIDSWKKVYAENLFTRLGFLIVSIISARAGSFALAIYSVGMHVLNINSDLGTGLKVSATALVGREYGAENMKKAKSYSEVTLAIGLLFAVFIGIFIAIMGKSYYGLFSNNTDFINTGAKVCILIGIICPIQSRQITLSGILQGLGEFKKVARISIISVTLINTIVTFVGTIILKLGVWGIWGGVFISQLVRMLLLNIEYNKLQLTEKSGQEKK